jgi:hypothetical protein
MKKQLKTKKCSTCGVGFDTVRELRNHEKTYAHIERVRKAAVERREAEATVQRERQAQELFAEAARARWVLLDDSDDTIRVYSRYAELKLQLGDTVALAELAEFARQTGDQIMRIRRGVRAVQDRMNRILTSMHTQGPAWDNDIRMSEFTDVLEAQIKVKVMLPVLVSMATKVGVRMDVCYSPREWAIMDALGGWSFGWTGTELLARYTQTPDSPKWVEELEPFSATSHAAARVIAHRQTQDAAIRAQHGGAK